MPWTSVHNLSASAPLPEGYRYQLITRSDIPDTVNAFASWHPGIAVGNASCHLKPSFYEERVVLDGQSERDLLRDLVQARAGVGGGPLRGARQG